MNPLAQQQLDDRPVAVPLHLGERANKSALPPLLERGLASSHLPGLDGLRAIAAFLVVFYHMGIQWCPAGSGVLLFFVLSGFLITWLLLKEESKSGTISRKKFYWRRSLRIFPAFYVYWLLLTSIQLLLHKHVFWTQRLAAFFYVNNYYQAIAGDPNTGMSHSWSLAIEEQFYLVWPTLFILLKDNKRRMRMCLWTCAWVWVYRWVLVGGFHINQGYIYEAFDTRFDHLLIGCMLAIVLWEKHWVRFFKICCSSQWLVFVTMGVFTVSAYLQYLYGTTYRDIAGFYVEPILSAILIVQVISFHKHASARWLNWKWIGYLGVISYSIYIYHPLVTEPLLKRINFLPRYEQIVVASLATVVVASISYFLIEKPALSLKDRFTTAGRRLGTVREINRRALQ